MERPDFLLVALSSLFPVKLGFLSNLAAPDMILILLVMLLIFGARKLPELMDGMEQAFHDLSRRLYEMTRLARGRSDLTEEEWRRILREYDIIAVAVLVIIVAAFVVVAFQGF
jgi:hypothetical protein